MFTIAYIALALLSGAPALVYQVVWTREVALLVGSQIEATSIVIAAFFGGLAMGAHWFGRVADRSANPLALYAGLEAAAGLLAVASLACLRAVGASDWVGLPVPALLALTGALLLPASFALGGSLPVLLRAVEARAEGAARSAGWLVGSNTTGAVVGVAIAAAAIPELGLRATLWCAAGGSLAVAALALALSLVRGRPSDESGAQQVHRAGAAPASPVPVLLAAAMAGVATLAFEVLSARMAAIRLGSSLYAWALVLGCVLIGLALGNLLSATRAARSQNASREVAWIEAVAAMAVAGGVGLLAQSPAIPSPGVTLMGVLRVALGIGPAALLMGAAFPYFVRLAVGSRDDGAVGGGFGSLTAANTAGGVAGSLLAPFVLVPLFGLVGGGLACAGINAALAIGLLNASARAVPLSVRPASWLRVAQSGAIFALVAVASLPALAPQSLPAGTRLDFVSDGRQATAAVARKIERRDLVVDGDPEASTVGAARATEELLAILPLLLHPEPRSLLEVGFGSGITFGMASTFPLEKLECVEIADSVLAAAHFFEPDNRGVASGSDSRVAISRGDGRAYLARHPGEYDVVIANTLHPWAVGATGLYSREYFGRLAQSLRPGGIAGQWLPIEQLGSDHLSAILRTFFSVFPDGALWWGANNVIALGSTGSLPELSQARFDDLPAAASDALAHMGIVRMSELRARSLASAAVLREVLGQGEVLSDDRPVLEARGARRRSGAPDTMGEATRIPSELEFLRDLARAGAAANPRARGIKLWLESQVLRRAGDTSAADARERMAEGAGLALARRTRGLRLIAQAAEAVAREEMDAARVLYEQGLVAAPDEPDGLFGLAVIARSRGDLAAAQRQLDRLTARRPDYVRGWNLLGVVIQQRGDVRAATAAFESALALDPNFREPLVNAGLLAAASGDRPTAMRYLARLKTLDPGSQSAEAQALEQALGTH